MDSQAEALRLQIDQLMKKARFTEVNALCEARIADANADIAVTALLGLKSACFGSGDFAGAEQKSAEALVLAREKGSPTILAQALCGAVGIRAQNADFSEETAALAQEALQLGEAEHYTRAIIEAKVVLGFHAAYHGSRKAAQAYLEDALTSAQHQPDRDLEASVYGALAELASVRREPHKAIMYSKRSLMLHTQTGNDMDRSIALSNLAYYYFPNARSFRSYEEALAYNREALALARELGYRYTELAALAGLGSSYRLARESEKAVAVLEEAVTLAREYGSKRYEQQSLWHLAPAYIQMKAYDKALVCLERQIAMSELDKSSLWGTYAYYEIGNVYQKQKRYAAALVAWRKALDVEKASGKRRPRYYFSQVIYRIYWPYYKFRSVLTGKPKIGTEALPGSGSNSGVAGDS